MVLGYARIATQEQDSSDQHLQLQEAGARRIFDDIGPAPGSARPGLAALLDYARPGDTICVTRLDRLARSMQDLQAIARDLKARGLHLLCLEERIVTAGSTGDLVYHLFDAIAGFERRLMSEQTREGQAAARRQGRRPGRPPVAEETTEALLRLVESGMSPAAAARHLGIGRSTAYRLVQAATGGEV